METATAFPGNTGQNPNSVAPLAEMLRLNGYSTGAFGKWHETAPWETSESGPFDNSAFRAGTDFSAIDDVGLYYSTFARGGYNVQLRGDAGGRGITGVRFVGCRWLEGAGFGPVDAVDVAIEEWTDNAYLGGEVIDNPAP
jgi:arylsulfatase A-like enzyme